MIIPKLNYRNEQFQNTPYPKKNKYLGAMGIFDFRNPNKRKVQTDTIRIQCTPKELRINESLISFPTNYTALRAILGDATRIEPIKNTKNNVYLWDEWGIYCSSPDPEKMLMLLLVIDARYGLGHQPVKNFVGSVRIDGQDIATSLKNVGHERPYMIRSIHKENKQVAIALGWNPRV